MMFTLDSTYRMSQTFIIQQNIFSFTTTVLTAFLFTLYFFMVTTIIHQKRNTFLASIQQIIYLKYQLFYLSFYQLSICLNDHKTLT